MRRLLHAYATLLALATLASTVWTSAGLAQGGGAQTDGARVALVIGNAAYKAQPLANPVNDARAMARTLEQVGFQVTRVENAAHRDMTRAVTGFGRRAAAARVALFYYAGHGVQVRGHNFLVPVDADITSEASVVSESVDVDNILTQMAGPPSGAGDAAGRLNLVILDACRNNPFEGRFRSTGAGLAAIDAPKGTLIAYATAPGRVAADGDRRNGLYTEHLLRAMQVPGLKVEELFKQVRIDVARATGDSQIPWEASSLTGDFYFRPPVAPPPLVADPALVELQLWRRARESGRPEHFREYLARYPQGEFAELATARLAPPAAPPPAPPPMAAPPPVAVAPPPAVPPPAAAQPPAIALAPTTPVSEPPPSPPLVLRQPAPEGEAAAALAALTEKSPGVVLPNALRLETPGADVPDMLRRFHGAWVGRWGAELDHVLVVETVEADGGVGVLYAWGDEPPARQKRGWSRHRGTIADGTLRLSPFANGARVQYTLDAAGALQGSYERRGRTVVGSLVRPPPVAVRAPDAAPPAARATPPATSPSVTGAPARLLVASAIPHLGDALRRRLDDQYPGLAEPKALAISREGEAAWAEGDSLEEAIRRALQQCELRARDGCVLYAANLEVRLPDGAWQPGRHIPRQLGRMFDYADVPFVRTAQRADMMRYWERRRIKALALSPGGAWGYQWGTSTEGRAIERALDICQTKSGGEPCFIYAVNDSVVFDADAHRGKRQ